MNRLPPPHKKGISGFSASQRAVRSNMSQKISVKKLKSSGFSLLEVLLAVTIAIGLGSMQLGQLKRNTEQKHTIVVGQQLKTVGNAFNAYLSQHYGNIVNMVSVSSPGTAEDPGPRACNAATRICTITSDTLRRAGLLPPSFSGRNSYGSTYNYYIRVTGTSPSLNVDGVVVTNDPYTVAGAVRHDLIGMAMLEAGADSGSTRTVANQINGYNGTWLETGYPGVNQIGLLAYRVGYGSSDNSAYLRTDGTIAMAGDLDMGANSIINVANVTGSGTLQGDKLIAQSNSPDALVLGTGATQTQIGNNGNRLKITNTGGVELVNPNSGSYTDLIAGNITGTGNLNISGYGRVGGPFEAQSLRTTTGSIESAGSIRSIGATTADGGFFTENGSYQTTNGNVSALNGTIQARDLRATGTGYVGSTLTVGGEILVYGDLRMGASGWTYNSGNNTVSTLNNANISANRITANGNLRTMANAVSGGACSERGLIALDSSTGTLMSCNGTNWRSNTISTSYSRTGAAGSSSVATCDATDFVTGCSAAYISRGTVDDPSNAAVINVNPTARTCTVTAPGGTNVTLQAVAVCAR